MHLVYVTHLWQQALDKQQSIRTLFINYSKAFDHINHPILLQKMATLGIQPHLLKWMHSLLSCRQHRVEIVNVYSDQITLSGGMLQGSWLGLYVFLILANDCECSYTYLQIY